jgi:hypothetical protein
MTDIGFGTGNSGVGTANSNPRIGPQVNEILKKYGLESLAGWASRAVINGWSQEQIMLEMYQRPEFKTRFAGLFERESLNLPPMSVEEYLDYERLAQGLGSTWGLRLTKAEVDGLIGRDVSTQELQERFGILASAVYESDAETRSELQRLFGIDNNGLFRYWMNPKAQFGTLQQQYRMGEIAGAALRSGYNQITEAQASRLQQAGITRDTAAQGFQQLAVMDELFDPMDAGEFAITQDMQIEYLAGDADVTQDIEERAERRKKEFEGTGGFAAGEEGFATGQAEK